MMDDFAFSSNKTDQLNADDLIGGPIVITVERVEIKKGDEAPIWIYHNDEKNRSYKPCLTVRKQLGGIWGKDTSQWVGRKIELFRDASVSWAGEAVGGIRIARMSHMEKPWTEKLMVKRGKRQEFTIHPLVEQNLDEIAGIVGEEKLTTYLQGINWITENQTRHDLAQDKTQQIIDRQGSFLAAINKEAGE